MMLFLTHLFTTPLQAKVDFESIITQLNLESRFVEVVMTDENSSQIIFSKDAQSKMYPASLTKILTAITAIEHFQGEYDRVVTVTAEDLAGLRAQKASVAGFVANEKVTIEDLIMGILLPSGADAINTIARIMDSSPEQFVQKVNRKAKEIGMTQTHFVNATGLHDNEHYSTAHDFNVLMQYALKNPKFKEFASVQTYRTKPNNKRSNGMLLRSTILGYQKPIDYIQGGKTGWTPQAGYNLSSFHQQDNKTIIITTADAYSRGGNVEDHEKIYLALLKSMHAVTVIGENQTIGFVDIDYVWGVKKIPIQITKDLVVKLPIIIDKDDVQIEIKHEDNLTAPIDKGTKYGTVTLYYNQQPLASENLVTNQDYKRSFVLYSVSVIANFILQNLVLVGIIGILIVIAISLLGLRSYFKNKAIRHGDRKWKL